MLAHRMSFQIHKRILTSGECVLHSCDNPGCVNPAHLVAGTQLENLADMRRKGRQSHGAYHASKCSATRPRGQDRHNAKLSNEGVGDIRWRYSLGTDTKIELANEFGVDYMSIQLIVQGKTWKHLPL